MKSPTIPLIFLAIGFSSDPYITALIIAAVLASHMREVVLGE